MVVIWVEVLDGGVATTQWLGEKSSQGGKKPEAVQPCHEKEAKNTLGLRKGGNLSREHQRGGIVDSET